MKKVVVAMLLLLPLIIVASVLVATSVISHEVYIAVEGVKLSVPEGETMEIGLSQRSFRLDATVYPTAARNRDVEWTIENELYFGDDSVEPVRIENGLITFSTYCTFDVVVTTVEGRKTARCNFYVKCDEMKGLSFAAPQTLAVGERYELSALLDPVDAEVYDVEWHSADPNVLEVDGNGILRGKAAGKTTVTASAQGFEYEQEITVTASVTKYGSSVHTAKETIGFADLGISSATALSGATVDETNQTIRLTADTAVIEVNGETVTITRVEDGVVIKNVDLLKERSFCVGRTPLYVEAAYADDLAEGTPDATILLPDGSVSTDGKVEFSEKGEFEVTVKSALYTYTESFSAVRTVDYVRLNTVDAEDKRGIAEQTMYATQRYNDKAVEFFEIPLSIQYPKEADWADFDLAVSDPDLLEITPDHTVRVKKAVEQPTEVVVSVTAHHSQFVSIPARASRHYLLIDGVNCYSYDDFVRATEERKTPVFMNNVVAKKGDPFVKLKTDWYGNGYMLDVSACDKEPEAPVVQVLADDVTVSNVQIRCDEGTKINTANGLHGAAIWIGSQEEKYYEDYVYYENVRVEYSIFENCYYCAAITLADATFDGCIFRNASNFGIHIPNDRRAAPKKGGDGKRYYRYIYSDVTINNCIVSDIIAPAVGISTFSSETNGDPLKTQSTFRQTGFFDVYNWQDVTSDAMLGREFLPNNPSANNMLKSLVTKFLARELASSDYDRVCYRTETNNYIHLGVITAGATNKCATVPEFEDERFKTFPLTMLDSYSPYVSPFIGGHELYRINLYLYEVDEKITPEMKFVADKEAFAKLRGEQTK